MSRKYKFYNKEGLYLSQRDSFGISFATVYLIDVFVRPIYCDILVDSLNYCRSNLGLALNCWCIMPSHVHLIFSARENNPDVLLGRFKEHTSKQMVRAIKENSHESRKEWMLFMPACRQAGFKEQP